MHFYSATMTEQEIEKLDVMVAMASIWLARPP
jgi:hypothetical protein